MLSVACIDAKDTKLIKLNPSGKFSTLDLMDNTCARFLECLISNILLKASRYLAQGIIIE
jgi:hypothetical protein